MEDKKIGCWAKLFSCRKKNNEENVQLLDPENFAHNEAVVIWDGWIEKYPKFYTFDDEAQYEKLVNDGPLKSCYEKFRAAGGRGHTESIEYLDKFPPKLRLALDKALNSSENLQSFGTAK